MKNKPLPLGNLFAGIPAVLTVCLLIAAVTGCVSESVQETPAPSTTLNIGVVVPSEGTLWLYGRECLKGLNLAVGECNAAGGVKGRKLALKVENNGGDPLASAEAVRRLASDSTVVAVVGPVTSNNALAAGAVAEHERIPLLSPYATNPSFTEIGEFVSRICFTDVFQSRTLARYSFFSLGIKHVAILYEKNNSYGEGLATFFTREFSSVGGHIVATETFSEGANSYRTEVQKMLLKRPEAIFLPAYYPQADRLIRDVIANNARLTLLGGDAWESLEKIELPIEVAQDEYPIFTTSHFSPEDIRPATQHFVQAYENKYGSTPNSLSALAYDAGLLIVNALQRASRLNREALMESIGSTREFPGATGRITLNEKRNAIKPVYILELRGGQFHLRAYDVPM